MEVLCRFENVQILISGTGGLNPAAIRSEDLERRVDTTVYPDDTECRRQS